MKPWTFYHYTSEKDLAIAKQYGIVTGILPCQIIPDAQNLKRNTFRFIRLVQWLTKNPAFIDLAAPIGPARTSVLPGRKSEYRITVKIPPEYRSNVVRWPIFASAMREIDENKTGLIKLDPAMEKEINLDLGNPGDWWVFGGIMPPEFIIAVDRNPCIRADVVSIKSA